MSNFRGQAEAGAKQKKTAESKTDFSKQQQQTSNIQNEKYKGKLENKNKKKEEMTGGSPSTPAKCPGKGLQR